MACFSAKPLTVQKTRVATHGYHHSFRSHNMTHKGLSSVKCMASGSLYGSSAGVLPTTTGTKQSATRLAQKENGRRYTVQVTAGNKGENGPFAPIVRVTRNAMGTKEFNQLRGKAISLHSQVIKDFCKQIGVDTKQVQGLIRLAKKNGEKLGFLA